VSEDLKMNKDQDDKIKDHCDEYYNDQWITDAESEELVSICEKLEHIARNYTPGINALLISIETLNLYKKLITEAKNDRDIKR
jgi:hypothetical protein